MIRQPNMAVLKTLTYLMFAMFAMTTDSVGIIIPEIVKTFRLELDGGRNVSICDDGGHRAGRLPSRSPRRQIRPQIDNRYRPDAFRRRVVLVPRRNLVCVFLCADGALRHRDRHFQNGRARPDRRHLSINGGTHFNHEHGRGILRGWIHRGTRTPLAVFESWSFLAMVVRDRRKHVRIADSHRSAACVIQLEFQRRRNRRI